MTKTMVRRTTKTNGKKSWYNNKKNDWKVDLE